MRQDAVAGSRTTEKDFELLQNPSISGPVGFESALLE
jgi:hypothetical protein